MAVLPLPLQVIGKTRLVVALDAVYVPVARSLPGIYVDFHIMAKTAEERRLGDLEQAGDDNDKGEKNKREENRDTLLVLEGPPLRLCIEVPEERFHQPIKAAKLSIRFFPGRLMHSVWGRS